MKDCCERCRKINFGTFGRCSFAGRDIELDIDEADGGIGMEVSVELSAGGVLPCVVDGDGVERAGAGECGD